MQRKAMPTEYRDENRQDEADAWAEGWVFADGQAQNDPLADVRQRGIDGRAAGRPMPKDIWDGGPDVREAWDGKPPVSRETRTATQAPFNPEATRKTFKDALDGAKCEEDVIDAWNKHIHPNEDEIAKPDMDAFERMYRNRRADFSD
jgi:hypothetical protein